MSDLRDDLHDAQAKVRQRLLDLGITTEEELKKLEKENRADKASQNLSILGFSVAIAFVWLLFPSLQYLLVFLLVFGVVYLFSMVYALVSAVALTNQGSLELEQIVKKYMSGEGSGLKDNLKQALTDILHPTDSTTPTPTKKLRKIKK